jgi:hypothetical protein
MGLAKAGPGFLKPLPEGQALFRPGVKYAIVHSRGDDGKVPLDSISLKFFPDAPGWGDYDVISGIYGL